ncbi:MAG: methyltransferase domain-containing protein [Saprospiraceae bacterium]|nr:methyltransferase domain-containing protein [Saprospiraceae bacterium]
MKTSKVNIDDQKGFYDTLWAHKKLNSLDLRRYVKILTYFIDIKRKLKQPKILDLGCGTGKFIAMLGEFGQAEGLELSTKAVETAQSLYPQVKYFQGNALTYKLNDKSYDVIISQEVIEHINEQDEYLKVCYNALKPGGYLILTTPNKNVLDHMKDGKNWSNQPIENTLSKVQLKRLIKKKFEILDYDSIIMNFGDQGVYKLINSRYAIGIANKLGLKTWREKRLGKLGYGLHQCILAVKK